MKGQIRTFATTAVKLFDNETKMTAARVLPQKANTGNSFKTFAEYRLKAIQRGPLTGIKIKPLNPLPLNVNHDFLSSEFFLAARKKAYNDWEK